MTEEWKDIKGYEGFYQISNFGRVKSLYFNREKILKLSSSRGYLHITLHLRGEVKTEPIHRLVMETFNPINNMNNYDVNHKDEDKTNNRIDNLEWMIHKGNCNYGNRNKKVSNKQRNDIKKSIPVKCLETQTIYPSIREAARATGLDDSAIAKTYKGIYKATPGYHWGTCEVKIWDWAVVMKRS